MRQKDPLERLRMLCSKSEKAVSDIHRLLMRWNVERSEWPSIVETLVNEQFVDEKRYAEAYVRDKLNFSRWGASKIRQGLYAKQIPSGIIDEAMNLVEPELMTEKLESSLRSKLRTIKSVNEYDLKIKLIRFGCSRGYSYDEVSDAVDKILS